MYSGNQACVANKTPPKMRSRGRFARFRHTDCTGYDKTLCDGLYTSLHLFASDPPTHNSCTPFKALNRKEE